MGHIFNNNALFPLCMALCRVCVQKGDKLKVQITALLFCEQYFYTEVFIHLNPSEKKNVTAN